MRPVELHAAVRQLEAGIEPLEREAAPGGPVYAIAGLVLPVAGVWHVQVETLISDFEKVRPSAGIHLH